MEHDNKSLTNAVRFLKGNGTITTVAEIADRLGYTRGALSELTSGKKPLSFPFKTKFKQEFDIDLDDNKVINIEKVPYFDGAVSAGLILGIDEKKIKPDAEISVPGLNDCDLAVNVWGDSMYPKFCSGEIVVCKSVPLDKELSYVRFGEAYVAMCDDGPVVKYIKKGKDENHLTFESENKHFEPYQVQKKRIQKLYLVKGVITRKNF